MKNIYWVGLAFLFLIPILIYTYVFGFGVWDSHEEWSKMGGALGGIYSPIIAFATLLLLYRQQKFSEKSHKEKTESEFIQRAYSKCESYITLAGSQCSKLNAESLGRFIALLEMHAITNESAEKELAFETLHNEFRPQLTSLTRAGITIHHMRNSKIDLAGQISDLRVYAASLIDIDLLLAHDNFHRNFMGDSSYYSFYNSPAELEDMEAGLKRLKDKKC